MIATALTDDRVRLRVIDTGPGISPHLRHDVFLPFTTTRAPGTGTGLSFARQIVLLHGGQIAIHRGAVSGLDLLLPTHSHRAGRAS